MKAGIESTIEEKEANYGLFSEEAKTGDPVFDAYINYIIDGMRFIDSIDTSEKEPMKPLEDKVNDFLMQNAGVSYRQFLDMANPEDIEREDYAELDGKNLKKRLFDYRAKLYLSALADCQKYLHQENYNDKEWMNSLLETVHNGTIPILKREVEEPTFEKIMEFLHKK